MIAATLWSATIFVADQAANLLGRLSPLAPGAAALILIAAIGLWCVRLCKRVFGRGVGHLARTGVAARQLLALRGVRFRTIRLMNHGERRVFAAVERAVASDGRRVFAQVNLGEILRCDDSEAFYAINAKRVDMLVVDEQGWPLLAIEVQGSGHYQGDADLRDAIKRQALESAGVGVLEVTGAESVARLQTMTRRALNQKAA